jgi:peptide/nickel transport system ATP-binding protein
MSAPLVTISELSVRYAGEAGPVTALEGVNLMIARGEILAVIGESGSGKSTLAMTLAGLLPPGATKGGSIAWADGPPRPGRDIGYVFQDPGASLNPVLSVGEQIAEVAVTHLGESWKQACGTALGLIERVCLPDPKRVLRAFPHQLSGGQRQRVAIAAAIAARPGLLIADEATSALDTVVQAEIVELLRRLARDDGMTLLFITHDIALASGLADRIAVFRNARLVETGPARQVIGTPREPYTQSLIAAHIDLSSPPLVAAS